MTKVWKIPFSVPPSILPGLSVVGSAEGQKVAKMKTKWIVVVGWVLHFILLIGLDILFINASFFPADSGMHCGVLPRAICGLEMGGEGQGHKRYDHTWKQCHTNVSRTDNSLLFIEFQHPEFANNVLFPDRILPEGDSDRLGYTITETPHSMYRYKATVSGIWGMFIRVVLYLDCNTRFGIS